MKVIVSGSRNITDYDLMKQAFAESGFFVDCIIHGDATGVDKLGSRYADDNSLPQVKFPADWNKYPKAAGPIRNSEMVKFVQDGSEAGLIALWDGKSRGTFDCLTKAFRAGLRVYVKCVPAVRTSQ